MNGASTVGRMLLAHFSDIIGALNMHIGSQFIASLLILILWTLAGSETDAIAFCVVFGVFSGMVIGLPPASIGNLLNCTHTTPETKHLAKKKLGHWTGMMYTFAAIPALTGPVIAGHLISKYNTYVTVQMWSGACLMLSCGCMLVARWYLPWVGGRTTPVEVARLFGKHKESVREKGKGSNAGLVASEALSQAPTRVPSTVPSRRPSSDKPNSPERMA
jgi:MCP family monocarboxylic acid transporter-like MFS transporter 10